VLRQRSLCYELPTALEAMTVHLSQPDFVTLTWQRLDDRGDHWLTGGSAYSQLSFSDSPLTLVASSVRRRDWRWFVQFNVDYSWDHVVWL